MSDAPGVQFSDTAAGDTSAYRPVSGLAVFSLLLGLSSPLAIFVPVLWVVPLAGIFLAGLALRRIAAEAPLLTGRSAALAGLALSVACATAAPVAVVSTRWWLRSEARPVVEEWFQALREGKPFEAHELMLLPPERMQIQTPLDQYYADRPEAKKDFKSFLQKPLVRTLLALKEGANARFYQAGELSHEDAMDQLELFYAVTYDEAGKKQSFFVRFLVDRVTNRDTGRGAWRIQNFTGGVRPPTEPK